MCSVMWSESAVSGGGRTTVEDIGSAGEQWRWSADCLLQEMSEDIGGLLTTSRPQANQMKWSRSVCHLHWLDGPRDDWGQCQNPICRM